MDKLIGIRVFRHVVELRSFVAASNRMQLSPAMVSKHIMALEMQLGTRLLNRTSRSLSLTEQGKLYFEQCCNILDSLDEVEARITKSTFAPKGVLRISAPVWAASASFVGILADFRRQYPDVHFDLDLSGRMVNLVEEGFDLALRASQSLEDHLIAKPIGTMTFKAIASPAYIQRVGMPSSPSDLSNMHILWYSLLPKNLSVFGLHGEKFTPIIASTNETLLHLAALQGLGIALLPTWLVEEDLLANRLVQVLPGLINQPIAIHAIYSSRRHLTPKVRTFIDFLSQDPRMRG